MKENYAEYPWHLQPLNVTSCNNCIWPCGVSKGAAMPSAVELVSAARYIVNLGICITPAYPPKSNETLKTEAEAHLFLSAQQTHESRQEEHHRIHDKGEDKEAAANKVQITEANKWEHKWETKRQQHTKRRSHRQISGETYKETRGVRTPVAFSYRETSIYIYKYL